MANTEPANHEIESAPGNRELENSRLAPPTMRARRYCHPRLAISSASTAATGRYSFLRLELQRFSVPRAIRGPKSNPSRSRCLDPAWPALHYTGVALQQVPRGQREEEPPRPLERRRSAGDGRLCACVNRPMARWVTALRRTSPGRSNGS